MRRPWSYLVYTALVLAICLVAASIFAFVTVRRSFPDVSGETVVPGLTGEVDVLRDEWGVPQLYADNPEDLFFAQGFVQAQDRFFEMDVRRHLTAGRLAELVGEDALEIDKFVRTLGWRRVAERELAILDEKTRRYLQAYSDGVNAYIGDRSVGQLSLEYSVLSLTGPDYAPEPWTPTDSLAWLKAMAWDLRSNMQDEIDRVLATQMVSPAQVAQLYPPYPYAQHEPIVTGGSVSGGVLRPVTPARPLNRSAPWSDVRGELAGVGQVAAQLPRLLGGTDGIGSNSWVVDGDLTRSGLPLLANDPHLAPSMPGIWYQMGLHCREVDRSCPYDVSGFTFSGLPGVVIGHNDRIAWGLTTMYADVVDLYLEKVDDEQDTYMYGRRELDLRTRTERFRVAGEDEPVEMTVRSTRRGPLLSDISDEVGDVGRRSMGLYAGGNTDAGEFGVSVQWTALRPGRTMDSLLAINRASTWQEFRRAAELFAVPSQNLLFADVEGNIGYQAPGDIPIRRTGDGLWPAPGWDPRYGWKGMVPFEALPSTLNPPGGVLVTANQAVTEPDYRYRLTNGNAYGYRSQRIHELLEGRSELSVDDMAAIQMDASNPIAAQLVPMLLDQRLSTFYYRQGQRLLESWDYQQPAESAAAAYFNVVWSNLLELTFHDQLPESVWPKGGERWYAVVTTLLDQPDSPWWDDVDTDLVVETRDDILRAALQAGRDEMTELQARDPQEWRWGHLHRLRLVNPALGTSGIAAVEALFNRGPYELGGGGGLVNATAWDATQGYQVTAVPSMRMVVSLGDLDESQWIQLTGQSGHAFSDHYDDQAPLWASGQLLPWPSSTEAVEAAAEETLTLVPAAPPD